MFDRLTSSLGAALKSLSGRGRLTEDNISETVREVRLALLDADVALPVVKSFTDAVKARAVGVEVTKSLTPGQAFIKVVHEELTHLMGEPGGGLNLPARRPFCTSSPWPRRSAPASRRPTRAKHPWRSPSAR